MASEWPLKTIAECASDEPYSTQIGPFGKALTPAEYTESGVPLLRGVNVNHGRFHDDDFVFISEETANRLAKFESFPGDVLLVHKGTLGKIGLMPKNRRFHRYIMGNSMLRVRCDPSILIPDYLYYWLSSADGTHYLLSRVSQVGVPQIQQPLTTLRQATLPVPPLSEQQAIACILGALDDKIELNRRRNRTLEAMARAIFQSWFVDFDPVRAKAAGCTPTGLSPDLSALFPNSFGDSPLGPIPKGWQVGTVGDLTEINGWTLGKSDHLDEIDYIEISEVRRGEIATISQYSRGSEPGRARRRLRHGDTALSTVRPDRGSYFLSIEPSPNLIASTGFAVLTANDGRWAFVHVLTTGDEFGQELGRLADGGAYPAVRPEVVAARPIVIPAEQEILSAFEKVAQPVFLQAEAGRKESRTLAALRDTLLPKLISGELRVPDAERIVGRAT